MKVGDTEVKEVADVAHGLRDAKEGDAVDIEVIRNNKSTKLKATMDSAPDPFGSFSYGFRGDPFGPGKHGQVFPMEPFFPWQNGVMPKNLQELEQRIEKLEKLLDEERKAKKGKRPNAKGGSGNTL